LSLVEDYVEARRMAHEHAAAASAEPFVQGAGRPFTHPGIAAAKEARREAREVLGDLLLTPRALEAAGLADVPEDDAPPLALAGDQAGL
jgi:hypothetical protein